MTHRLRATGSLCHSYAPLLLDVVTAAIPIDYECHALRQREAQRYDMVYYYRCLHTPYATQIAASLAMKRRLRHFRYAIKILVTITGRRH